MQETEPKVALKIFTKNLVRFHIKLLVKISETKLNDFYHSGFSDYWLQLNHYIDNVSADVSSSFLQVFLVDPGSLSFFLSLIYLPNCFFLFDARLKHFFILLPFFLSVSLSVCLSLSLYLSFFFFKFLCCFFSTKLFHPFFFFFCFRSNFTVLSFFFQHTQFTIFLLPLFLLPLFLFHLFTDYLYFYKLFFFFDAWHSC